MLEDNCGAQVAEPCKVDYEQQLEYCRKEKAKVEKGIEDFKGLPDCPYELKRESYTLFGAMHANLVEIEAREARILKNIDADSRN